LWGHNRVRPPGGWPPFGRNGCFFSNYRLVIVISNIVQSDTESSCRFTTSSRILDYGRSGQLANWEQQSRQPKCDRRSPNMPKDLEDLQMTPVKLSGLLLLTGVAFLMGLLAPFAQLLWHRRNGVGGEERAVEAMGGVEGVVGGRVVVRTTARGGVTGDKVTPQLDFSVIREEQTRQMSRSEYL
jgi:hypothetical protein